MTAVFVDRATGLWRVTPGDCVLRRQLLPAQTKVWNTTVGRLRAAGLIEGASFLLLLGVAMPLKYLANMPLAVRVVGMIHGVLFIVFCILLARAMKELGWSLRQASVVFVAALLPFGPLLIDRRLKQADEARREPD